MMCLTIESKNSLLYMPYQSGFLGMKKMRVSIVGDRVSIYGPIFNNSHYRVYRGDDSIEIVPSIKEQDIVIGVPELHVKRNQFTIIRAQVHSHMQLGAHISPLFERYYLRNYRLFINPDIHLIYKNQYTSMCAYSVRTLVYVSGSDIQAISNDSSLVTTRFYLLSPKKMSYIIDRKLEGYGQEVEYLREFRDAYKALYRSIWDKIQ